MDKIAEQTQFSNLSWQLIYGNDNSQFKTGSTFLAIGKIRGIFQNKAFYLFPQKL